MRLSMIDWIIIGMVMTTTVLIGVIAGRRAGRSSEDFFLGHRSLPWWLLGFSMVATTFSTDTPNLVTDLTRRHGVAGNWSWWAFLLTGAVTTFFFARLWRRSGVVTDIEFYELRYGGRSAAFLRVGRALYIGLLFNILMMAGVTLAATKFGAVLLGLSPATLILLAGSATVLFSTAGGLKGILYSDLFLFVIAIIGAGAAAAVALSHPQVGGLEGLFAHERVRAHAEFWPSADEPALWLSLLALPLLIQWWSVWYPGSEPGGGGYVAQRMLAARDERHAMRAMLFFNIAHYALRPWPWILVALASLIVFPDLNSLRHAFPLIDGSVIGDDMAYPAMLTFLPPGWMGFVAASLIAAYMSTMSTQLNLGSAYIVTDIYTRFWNPQASERRKVAVARLSTVLLMILVGALALMLDTAAQVFTLLLSVGAGTGLLFMLRFYWSRINGWSEISAMLLSLTVSILFQTVPALADFSEGAKMIWAVGITTAGWLIVTLLTPPESDAVLQRFYEQARPAPHGWRRQADAAPPAQDGTRDRISTMLVATLSSIALVYGLLFAIGYALKAEWLLAAMLALVAAAGALLCHHAMREGGGS